MTEGLKAFIRVVVSVKAVYFFSYIRLEVGSSKKFEDLSFLEMLSDKSLVMFLD